MTKKNIRNLKSIISTIRDNILEHKSDRNFDTRKVKDTFYRLCRWNTKRFDPTFIVEKLEEEIGEFNHEISQNTIIFGNVILELYDVIFQKQMIEYYMDDPYSIKAMNLPLLAELVKSIDLIQKLTNELTMDDWTVIMSLGNAKYQFRFDSLQVYPEWKDVKDFYKKEVSKYGSELGFVKSLLIPKFWSCEFSYISETIMGRDHFNPDEIVFNSKEDTDEAYFSSLDSYVRRRFIEWSK